MMRQAEGGEVNTEEIVLVKDRDVVRNRKKKRVKERKGTKEGIVHFEGWTFN